MLKLNPLVWHVLIQGLKTWVETELNTLHTSVSRTCPRLAPWYLHDATHTHATQPGGVPAQLGQPRRAGGVKCGVQHHLSGRAHPHPAGRVRQ